MTPELPYYPLAFKSVTLSLVQGFLMTAAEQEIARELINEPCYTRKLQVPVGARYRLDDIVEAHRRVESGLAIGNVVLNIA